MGIQEALDFAEGLKRRRPELENEIQDTINFMYQRIENGYPELIESYACFESLEGLENTV